MTVDALCSCVRTSKARDGDVIDKRGRAVVIKSLEHDVNAANGSCVVTVHERRGSCVRKHILNVAPVSSIMDLLNMHSETAHIIWIRNGSPDVVTRIAFCKSLPRPSLHPVRNQAALLLGTLDVCRGERISPRRTGSERQDHATAVAALCDKRRLRAEILSLPMPATAATLKVFREKNICWLPRSVDGGCLLRASCVARDNDVIEPGVLAIIVKSFEHKVRGSDRSGIVALRVATIPNGEHVLDILPVVVVVASLIVDAVTILIA